VVLYQFFYITQTRSTKMFSSLMLKNYIPIFLFSMLFLHYSNYSGHLVFCISVYLRKNYFCKFFSTSAKQCSNTWNRTTAEGPFVR
jgi:hypothetical protein